MNLISPQLQAFMAVVEYKTVHAAADFLNLTQTAVTQRIRSLENQLKIDLFLRSRRGMDLTHEGEALLRYCHSVKALEGETLAQIAGMGSSSEVEISIVGPSSIMRRRVVLNLADFTKLYPQVLLNFTFDDGDNLQNYLRAGICDFAIMSEENISQEMAKKLLLPEKNILVCCQDWSHRKTEEIIQNETIIDFYDSDKGTYDYLDHFQLLHLANKSRHFVNNIDSMADLVVAGLGYSILTEEFANDFLENNLLFKMNEGKYYQLQKNLVWYRRTEIANYFLEIINRIG